MSLWVDKHRPNALHKMDYHKKLSNRMTAMVRAPGLGTLRASTVFCLL